MRIPRFGRSYVVPAIQGIRKEDLAKGFGHFPETALPGQRGNCALAGHRVTHGEPLRDMPNLRVGDKVVVETSAPRTPTRWTPNRASSWCATTRPGCWIPFLRRSSPTSLRRSPG
ncbi:sortase domain-containing protein [Actinopolymorpha cephalotaxi]|uniref:sortase domain-containing protein n=1 Tax=Actinopolymorpha cephalotaxi TaxID=504797 RepID=UPI00364154B2